MSELPRDSERLLAVAPVEFVSERQALARELREVGRSEEAKAVGAMRKPSAVVSAVNRAARGRSKAAHAAAEAADRVEQAQAEGDPEAFKAAARKLDEALDLLAEVAVAHVAPSGKKPTEAMRRRVHDLLRRAVATPSTRAALRKGVLVEEQEAAGFSPVAGAGSPTRTRRRGATPTDSRERRQAGERRRRVAALRSELERARRALAEAELARRAAEHDHANAEREVARLQSKLDRLG